MPRELSQNDPLPDVVGLRRTDNVLLLGGNFAFPTLKKYVGHVEEARKSSHMNKLLFANLQYERVFIARENVLDEVLVLKAIRLVAPGGLVCFFSDQPGLREGFRRTVEENFPTADVWDLQSNVGDVVVANAQGTPTWAR